MDVDLLPSSIAHTSTAASPLSPIISTHSHIMRISKAFFDTISNLIEQYNSSLKSLVEKSQVDEASFLASGLGMHLHHSSGFASLEGFLSDVKHLHSATWPDYLSPEPSVYNGNIRVSSVIDRMASSIELAIRRQDEYSKQLSVLSTKVEETFGRLRLAAQDQGISVFSENEGERIPDVEFIHNRTRRGTGHDLAERLSDCVVVMSNSSRSAVEMVNGDRGIRDEAFRRDHRTGGRR
ncbi:hypothetical protein C8Q75DRAFT_812153 [Abortiporus biennis]|nr:hypothetical protein C8Q75DRAFT_812153 [Abortiporus biennis]